jgi:HD-GYP domain-containing protein (c-di-GMP phosphodiesterase class II)
MVQDRPYRKGLSKDAVADFMQQLQANGRIEAMIGDVLNANLDEMIVKARLHETESPLIS